MCGRYSLAYRPEELASRTREMNLVVDQIRSGEQSTIQYNMCPGRYGAVYRHEHGNSDTDDTSETSHDMIGSLDLFKWGLIPAYSKDQSMAYKTFNCRIESLGTKRGLWTSVKQHKRCLIPAEGYFEWETLDKKTKIPYFVTRKDGHPIYFAGLWDRNDRAGEPIFTYTMITQPACPFMEWLHPRMPLMVDVSNPIVEKWLDPDYKWTDDLMDIGKAAIDHEKLLNVYQVAKDVGNVKNNYPELRNPVSKRKHEEDMTSSSPKKQHKGAEDQKLTSFFTPVKKESMNGAEKENEDHGRSDGIDDVKKEHSPKKEKNTQMHVKKEKNAEMHAKKENNEGLETKKENNGRPEAKQEKEIPTKKEGGVKEGHESGEPADQTGEIDGSIN